MEGAAAQKRRNLTQSWNKFEIQLESEPRTLMWLSGDTSDTSDTHGERKNNFKKINSLGHTEIQLKGFLVS